MSRPRLKTFSPINGDCGLEYRGLDMNGEFVVAMLQNERLGPTGDLAP
jgi:hypothetical protein